MILRICNQPVDVVTDGGVRGISLLSNLLGQSKEPWKSQRMSISTGRSPIGSCEITVIAGCLARRAESA